MHAGVGTIIVGLLKCSCWTVLVGLAQLVTAPILIGWVWSILWGYELYKRASYSPPPERIP